MLWQVLHWLFLQCGVKCILARWLMPSPKTKKQICSWQSFVMLCQVSCVETQENGNTKYFVRRNRNNILWRNIYVSSCQGGTAVSQGPVATSLQQGTAGSMWSEVDLFGFSASCYLLCYGTGDCSRGDGNHYLWSRTFAKRKHSQMGQTSPPSQHEEGQRVPSGPQSPRPWWRGGSEGVLGWPTMHRGVAVLSSSRQRVAHALGRCVCLGVTCPQPRAVEIPADGEKEASKSQGPFHH